MKTITSSRRGLPPSNSVHNQTRTKKDTYMVWWFNKNDTPDGRSVLRVHPKGNPRNPLTGVFATRSPRRPNLIALTLCKVVAVKDNVIEIERTDAFDGTPVLDIKPYLPGYDTTEDASVPQWTKH